MNIKTSLKRIESAMPKLPCPVCSRLPVVYLIQSPADQDKLDAMRQDHAAHCTCGGEFPIRRTIRLVLPGSGLMPDSEE